VFLESAGLPLPGESLVIAAAIYAATTHHMSIVVLVPVVACDAITGDQLGYIVGRWIGYRLLTHWGRKAGLSDERLEVGRYLFRRYGGQVVFFGRFVAVLRNLAAVLAGANCMPWRNFLLWNALGGIGWSSLYGFGAWALGDAVKRISGPARLAVAAIGIIVLIAAFFVVRRNKARLLDDVHRDMASG
jgi:membrane protein DedA with SNARE-associated domain